MYQRESQYKRNKSVKKDLRDRVGIAVSNGTINASDTYALTDLLLLLRAVTIFLDNY